MSRNQLNPRRRVLEREREQHQGESRGRNPNPVASPIREVASNADDRQPVKVRYDRIIRPNWSEPGQDALNLTRELADLRSREALLDDRDKGFIRHLEAKAIRGAEVWVSPVQQRRLVGICRRFTDPAYEAGWRKRQADLKVAASEPTYLTPESVNEQGGFQLATFAYRR